MYFGHFFTFVFDPVCFKTLPYPWKLNNVMIFKDEDLDYGDNFSHSFHNASATPMDTQDEASNREVLSKQSS